MNSKVRVKYVRKLDNYEAVEDVVAKFDRKWLNVVEVLPEEFPLNQMKYNDIVIVFGGDGTMLHTMKQLVTSKYNKVPEVPALVGMHNGRVGYLNSFSVDTFDPERIGSYSEEFYPLLMGANCDASSVPDRAVNEIMLSASNMGLPVTIGVDVDGERLFEFGGTGVVVSTPTGSTAINLSAGGPIVCGPDSELFIITPILPHSVKSRPIVVTDSKSRISIQAIRGQMEVYADGQKRGELYNDDVYDIIYDGMGTEVVQPHGWSPISVLQKKILTL